MGSAVTTGGAGFPLSAPPAPPLTLSWLGPDPVGPAALISPPTLTPPLTRPLHTFLPPPPPAPLEDREEVGQGLHRVQEVAEPVDDRHRRVPAHLDEVLVRVHTRHDAVRVAGEHLGRVGQGLSAPDLDLVRAEVQGVAEIQ